MRILTCHTMALASTALLLACTVPAGAQEIRTLPIGAAAPDFDLPGVDGKMHRLADYDDATVLVIVFTCNHCPTAQAYEERIKQLAADYRDKGVVLVAISPNDPNAVRLDELGYSDLSDTLDEMKIRAQDKSFNFPYLYDGATQTVSKAYGPVATPHVFVFDQARKLRYAGRVDNNERNPEQVTSRDARNAIEALLAGRPVPVETTRVFGCSIKWASKSGSVAQAFAAWAKELVSVEPIDLEGVRKLVKNDSGKLRLINFWATHCGPCVVEFPELVTINRMYRGRDFEMVSINLDAAKQKDKVLALLKDQQASFKNYQYGFDAGIYALMEAVDESWPGPIPYTLLVKPGGEILYRHLGQIDPLEVKKTIVEYVGRTYR
ncbi:MAG: redoxin domain-containing protein [Sedimentisphaerales bacterium]|nr:redoxin domain-containing protein [Sedimentisphaerales bacterium]